MLNKKIHSYIYLTGLCLVAFFMPLSEYMTSFSQFILITNFLLELDIKKKWKRLMENKEIFIFLLLFFTSVIWAINSENIGFALKDIKIKSSILAMSVIIGTSDRVSKSRINIILLSFITGVFISTFAGILAYYGILFEIETINVRNISLFISHIRLSLMICLSIFVLIYWIYNKTIQNKILIIVSLILIAWFIYFLTIAEAFTGLLSLVIISFLIWLYLAIKEKRKIRKIIYCSITIMIPVFLTFYIGLQVKNFYEPTTVQNVSEYTKKGNLYYNNFDSFIVENGNYIYRDISYEEIYEDWPKRSNLDIHGFDHNNQNLMYTLLKYMTSKGLTKDSEGIAQLTEEDIRNIEKGEPNYKYAGKNGINSRIYLIILGLDTYYKTGDASGYSIAQRIEYHKVGYKLFKEHFWFGTGTGDIEDDFKKMYEDLNSQLSPMYRLRAHDQFLTFFICYGIFGGILCLMAWLWPAISKWDIKNYYFIVFFLIATISMFSDDTLETSTGVVFVSFFYSLFLWGKDDSLYKKNNYE